MDIQEWFSNMFETNLPFWSKTPKHQLLLFSKSGSNNVYTYFGSEIALRVTYNGLNRISL